MDVYFFLQCNLFCNSIHKYIYIYKYKRYKDIKHTRTALKILKERGKMRSQNYRSVLIKALVCLGVIIFSGPFEKDGLVRAQMESSSPSSSSSLSALTDDLNNTVLSSLSGVGEDIGSDILPDITDYNSSSVGVRVIMSAPYRVAFSFFSSRLPHFW